MRTDTLREERGTVVTNSPERGQVDHEDGHAERRARHGADQHGQIDSEGQQQRHAEGHLLAALLRQSEDQADEQRQEHVGHDQRQRVEQTASLSVQKYLRLKGLLQTFRLTHTKGLRVNSITPLVIEHGKTEIRCMQLR